MTHPSHCLFTTKLGTESIVSAIIWYVAIQALLYGMIGANWYQCTPVINALCVYVLNHGQDSYPFLKRGFFATLRLPRMFQENVVRIKRLLMCHLCALPITTVYLLVMLHVWIQEYNRKATVDVDCFLKLSLVVVMALSLSSLHIINDLCYKLDIPVYHHNHNRQYRISYHMLLITID